mgnify:FL=1
MKKQIKLIFYNLLFLFILLESAVFVSTKINLIPDGITPNVTLNANKDFGYWHPKDSTFKIATKCWSSKVEFNDIGLKSDKKINFKKQKPRIAILGDSMTENSQLSNSLDFRSKLQGNLPNFEIINFSVSSTGLADHLNVYNKLIKKFDIDYLFYYPTINDLSDNHVKSFRPNRITYKIENNLITEVNENKSEFYLVYNSSWNKFKREKLLFLKKNLNIYKLYSYLKYEKDIFNLNNSKKIFLKQPNKNLLLEKKKIYQFLVNLANNEMFNEVDTLVIMNVDNNSFLKDTAELKILKNIYKENKFVNYYDPKEFFIEYLNNEKMLKKPYLGYECDAHYSELGVQLLSDYTTKKFLELKKKN